MTATNRELALRAQQIAAGSDGLKKRAATTAAVALASTNSVAAARAALAQLWLVDVRMAAIDIIGWLASEGSET